MANVLNERDWEVLLQRIQDGKCTPFLGAGVNHGILPLGAEISEDWSRRYGYPLEDSSDLLRVAQFLAINSKDWMSPKEEIIKLLKRKQEEWQKKTDLKEFFSKPDEPLGVLAELPLPIYMTTNYDNLILQALRARNKEPRRELCRWNKYVRSKASLFDTTAGFDPTPANPVVFHLHGHDEVPESLVLTEDDYLDFLVNISRQQDLLHPRIQEALTGSSLLFIGYRLADWNFRVLFRGLVGSMEASLRRISVAVQLPPEGQQSEREKAQKYLTDYFDEIKVRVYWGDAREFAKELKERWRRFAHEQ